MSKEKSKLAAALHNPQFPLSNKYDPIWVFDNLMGPNVLWLTEALTQIMDLRPGMRILDLGCGKALSSIFLAKEFELEVWATDLWIEASDNWGRIVEAGLSKRVFPIHAEAHQLPFAYDFFDALVSLDAYHYFGTDDLYLGYISRFIRPGGLLAIIVPGLVAEFNGVVPEHLQPYWLAEFWSLHSPSWWLNHWQRSGLVEVLSADLVEDGWKQWLTWLEISETFDYPHDPQELKMLQADEGRNLGFTRLVARRVEVE